MSLDQIGLWAGFVLTLMVFSYLLGDNFLYRLAVYVFAGLSAGYITTVTFDSVILPWIRGTVLSGDTGTIIVGVIPLALGALLLLKTTTRFNRVGNLALAFLIAVGAAVALVGAISGTLLPLIGDTVNTLRVNGDAADAGINLVNAALLILGVIGTLAYFQYIARRNPNPRPATTPETDVGSGRGQRGPLTRALGTIGQGFLVVTLGALYGGAILTGLTILSERIAFLVARVGGG